MAVKTVEIDNLINGQLYGFRMFPRNLKGQYQTRDDRGTATATPVAFSLPTYTGQHTIFGDINEGRIEMYTSGSLSLSAGTYDMFLVGGGAGGSWIDESRYFLCCGSGSGYTTTDTFRVTNNSKIFSVLVGSGGDVFTNGSVTSVKDKDNYYTKSANGGTCGDITGGAGSAYGGNGGSGGGAVRQSGGFDGSDGGGTTGGKGQGTTTRCSFNNTLYAGGSGGGDGDGLGGAGGGGRGAYARNGIQAVAGTPNTGGAGGAGDSDGGAGNYKGAIGGSGIAIARWKRN